MAFEEPTENRTKLKEIEGLESGLSGWKATLFPRGNRRGIQLFAVAGEEGQVSGGGGMKVAAIGLYGMSISPGPVRPVRSSR